MNLSSTPASKTVVWIIRHATKMLNLDMVGPMGSGEVPDTTWADACSGNECGID